jgi:hypothetical protein
MKPNSVLEIVWRLVKMFQNILKQAADCLKLAVDEGFCAGQIDSGICLKKLKRIEKI